MEENGKKYFYHNDHLGGTNVVTDETGRQVEYIDYQPFGVTKTEDPTALRVRHKFTGKEMDESTGLYNFSARSYDPKLGIFISPDPLEILLTRKEAIARSDIGFRFDNVEENNIAIALLYNPQNLNKYSYCLNNPINYTDPLGLWVGMGEKPIKVLGISVGSHTVTILRPDNPNEFKNDRNTNWYTNTSGSLETTLSANPNWKLTLKGPLFGSLKATPNISGDRPGNLRNIRQISDNNRSDTQLIRDILASANQYKDNLPYDPTPAKFDRFYNSNSYTYGILRDARVTNIPNLPGWQPGADKPIPLNKKE